MTLLLTSGGIDESFQELFLSLLSKPPKDISVAYITTAAFGEDQSGDMAWTNFARDDLKRVGITNIQDIDIRGKKEKELFSLLSQKDIILVNGGNTFYLLKYARETGFDTVIKQLVSNGKLYIGVSAGSYITCPTIQHAYWKYPDRNVVDLTDLTGFNFVPFLLVAHFTEEIRSDVEQEAKKVPYPVVALVDTQAVLVTDTTVKIIGGGKKE